MISTLKKSFKKGKSDIIDKYFIKIHHLQNQKGDALKVAKCQRKAEKLKEEVAVLKKIKARDMCKMALSKDKDWKNVISQDGVSLEDRCHALLANHSAVQAALENLHSKSRCPALLDEVSHPPTERQASKIKKKQKRRKSKKEDQQEKEKDSTLSKTESWCFQDSGSENSGKENRESCTERSSSTNVLSVETPPKRRFISEEGKNLESPCETVTTKRKKTYVKDELSREKKAEKQRLKKGKPPKMKKNAALKKKKHLVEQIPDMQREERNTDFLSTGKCVVKAKKRKKKGKSSVKEEKDLISSETPGIIDCLKDQGDDSGGSGKENRSISFSIGTALKKFHVVHKNSESDEPLESLCQSNPKSRKRKASKADNQLREEQLVKVKLPKMTELQSSSNEKPEFPTSPERTSEINDKALDSSILLESQHQTKTSKRKKSSKKEDQLEEKTNVQSFEEKLSRKRRESFSEENQRVEERVELRDSSLDELPEIMQFSKEDNKENNSEDLGRKNRKKSRKRKYSDQSNNVAKKLCKGSEIEIDSELRDSIPSKPKQKKLLSQAKQFNPDNLIGLVYQLDLSILCSFRKSLSEHLYPSLTLMFGDPEISKFSDIVIRHQEKSVQICVESVDSFIPNNIGYSRLFNKERLSCSLNSYFLSFFKHVISNSDALRSVEYLIIFTNAGLDLTEEKELKRGLLKNFYPFRFESINVEDHDVMKTFLCTRNTLHKFYQFSQDKTTRKELLKHLKISPTMQKSVGKRFPPGFEKEIKEAFLDKLVFAVDQPNREELNCITRTEVKQQCEHGFKYMKLQKQILRELEKHGQNVSKIIYEFYTYVLFLHDVFLQKNMLSLKIDAGSSDASFGVTIDYKGRTSYFKTHYAEGNISYSHLFPSKPNNSGISIDRMFTIFVQKSKDGLRYFIIYTNGDLELNKEMELKKSKCKDFYPFKFDNVDIQKKKYKVLRNCSCIEGNSFYQFSKEDKTREKLLSLLKLPSSLEEAKGLNDKELKEQFLDKLIFMANQPKWKKLHNLVTEKVDSGIPNNKHHSVGVDNQLDTPYTCEGLFEIALRWFESYDTSPIRREEIEKILEDINCDFLNSQKMKNSDIAEIFRFARGVVGREGTFGFRQFLRFLLKGDGRHCLGVLKKEGIKLSTLSVILHGAGNSAIKAFKSFYDCLFDKEGGKTHYTKTLEQEGIYLSTISGLLSKSRANAAIAFTDLYDLWFDYNGEKTKYLKDIQENGIDLIFMCSLLRGAGTTASRVFKELYDVCVDKRGKRMKFFETLEKEGMTLSHLSCILSGAGNHAPQAFKDLCDLWFGSGKGYSKTIKKEGISMSSMTSLLNKSGRKAAEAFTDLYNLWFDEEGGKKLCLKTLEREGIGLSSIISILSSPGSCAAKAFHNFYCLLFDELGNKTQYLKALENGGIKFSNISCMLAGAGTNAQKAFKELYGLWFDERGNKRKCLKFLEEKGISISNVSNILSGAACHAPKAFKDLVELWFDKEGNKKQCLKTIEEEGIVSNVSSILHRAGCKAPLAFKNLYNVWFDKQGNKKQCLEVLEKKGIKLSNVSGILIGAKSNAAKAFTDLYNLWFNKKGKKTKYLKSLEKEGINLVFVSSILHGSGTAASKAFKELYDLLFDEFGNKRQCLMKFEEEGIKLSNISSILKGAGSKAAKVFKDFYHVWFDDQGNKKPYLETLEKKGVRISNISSILSGGGCKAPKAFKCLYDLWFDDLGNKKKCLQTLEERNINLSNVISILTGAGSNAPKAFKELYDLWFDNQGNKTEYIKTLEDNEISLSSMSHILHRAGNNSAKAFKDLHNLWFVKKRRTKYLKSLQKEGIDMFSVSKILSGAGSNAPKAFIELYDLWFDDQGNKTKYVKDFERQGMSLSDVSRILKGAGNNGPKAFKDFYESYFENK